MALSRAEIERRRRRLELLRRGRGVVVFRSKLLGGVEVPPEPPVYNPGAALYTASEDGAVWDVSDSNTMFQDSMGLVASAVDQPVGFMADKRRQSGWQSIAVGDLVFTKSQGDGVLSVNGNTVTITGATTDTRVVVSNTANGNGMYGATVPFLNGAARWSVTASWTTATGVNMCLRGGPVGCNNGTITRSLVNLNNSSIDFLQVGTGTVSFVIDPPDYWVGNHLRQSSTSMKPILRANGLLRYLEYDGFDDILLILGVGNMPQPFTRHVAYRQRTWAASNNIFGSPATIHQGGSSPRVYLYAGVFALFIDTVTLTTPHVLSGFYNGASSSIERNNDGPVVGDPGADNLQTWNVNGQLAQLDWYGEVIIGRALTAAERTSVKSYLATKSGVTL